MPIPNVYFKAIMVLALCASFFIGGFYVEHLRLVAYQEKVSAEGKIQEQKNKDLLIQQQLINKQVTNDYQNKLDRIKSYYGGLHYSSSGKLPPNSQTTISINGITKDYLSIAQDCAIETEKLISLQSWINEQLGLK
jgi:hypothetical protein